MPRFISRFFALAAIAMVCSVASAQSNDGPTIVRLQENGTFSGNIIVRWVTGKQEPVAGTIELSQAGTLIASSNASESGEFKFEALEPGAYTALVSATDISAEFDLELVASDQGSEIGDHLTATMTPLPEGCEVQLAVNDSAFWTPTNDFIGPEYVDGAISYGGGG